MFACKESCSLASRNLLPRSVLVKKKVFRHSNTNQSRQGDHGHLQPPNKTPQEIEAMINDRSVDILLSFSEACREKFEQGCRSDNQTPFFTCTWLKLICRRDARRTRAGNSTQSFP